MIKKMLYRKDDAKLNVVKRVNQVTMNTAMKIKEGSQTLLRYFFKNSTILNYTMSQFGHQGETG